MKLKLSKYILSTDILDDYGIKNKVIMYSTISSTSILLNFEIFDKLINQDFYNIDFLIIEKLIQSQFLVPINKNEFDFIMKENEIGKKQENGTLNITIQPSANCQLGCHYCGQTHSKHVANDNIIDKYVERIEYLLNQKNYTGLSICWYGGEPLTGLKAIKETTKKLMKICVDKKIEYMPAFMVTNGVSLKPNIFTELVNEYKVKDYQITIDGTSTIHDKRRITKKTQEPTFEIIFKNIIQICNLELYKLKDCKILIRINVDKSNYFDVDNLIDLIIENKLNDKVILNFSPIVDWAGNNASKNSLTREDFASKQIEWNIKLIENGMKIEDLPIRSFAACMVDMKDSEVYDAFGNMYPCWEFPYTEMYGSGDNLIGNLMLPKESYNMNAHLRNFDKVIESGKTWCKTCNHLPICGGACPKKWMEGTPACPPFKFNYKERLVLDYYIGNSKLQIN